MPKNYGYLRYAFCGENKFAPTKAFPTDAGYDLAASEECTIKAGGKALIKTGLILEIPEEFYGRIAPRSSLAWKGHIDVGAGVIDASYRAEVGIVLFNLGGQDYHIKVGDRIAQLIIERYHNLEPQEVALSELSSTARGTGGFGSTGK